MSSMNSLHSWATSRKIQMPDKPHRVNLTLDQKTYDLLRQSAFDRRMQPTALAGEIVKEWVKQDEVVKP